MALTCFGAGGSWPVLPRTEPASSWWPISHATSRSTCRGSTLGTRDCLMTMLVGSDRSRPGSAEPKRVRARSV